jgi:hypothetical protein
VFESLVPFDSNTVLAEHNAYRALHSAPPLTYDPAAAAFAAALASTCDFSSLAFISVFNNDTEYSASAAASPSQAFDFTGAVDFWYGTGAGYNYSDPGGGGSDVNDGSQVNEFAQVWPFPAVALVATLQGLPQHNVV